MTDQTKPEPRTGEAILANAITNARQNATWQREAINALEANLAKARESLAFWEAEEANAEAALDVLIERQRAEQMAQARADHTAQQVLG